MNQLKQHPAFRPLIAGLALLILAGFLVFWEEDSSAQLGMMDKIMPEFKNQTQSAWINTTPLKKSHLKGSVVLIEVWTSI